jgi:hypothetical protein
MVAPEIGHHDLSLLRRMRQRAFVILDPCQTAPSPKPPQILQRKSPQTLFGSSALKEYIIILVRNDHETRRGKIAALF